MTNQNTIFIYNFYEIYVNLNSKMLENILIIHIFIQRELKSITVDAIILKWNDYKDAINDFIVNDRF